MTYLTGSFNKKSPPYGSFAPMSNLTKIAFWISHFGPIHFDWVFLVGFFTGFFIRFVLLNHCDNNIVWATTKNIYYFKKYLKLM